MYEKVCRCDWVSDKGNPCNAVTNTVQLRMFNVGDSVEHVAELCDDHAEIVQKRFRLRPQPRRGRKLKVVTAS